ncbi:unnamed protein product [Auanema sp. JU1783]|nr:unnamed protein product [Auanema sp. JU1783]
MSETTPNIDLAQLMQQLHGDSGHSLADTPSSLRLLPNGKKTKGRVKIKMEYIGNKLRRYTTFSKRKTGIMKKAYELSTLTGTQVMLLVASETGHVYTFATKKLQPMISSDAGKALIQSCLNAPGEESDLQPSRTEFTFETGSTPNNSRKRKINEVQDPTAASIASFLPTMVPSTLFTHYNEEEYNADSGDDTDSEEHCEVKEEPEEAKDLTNGNNLAASLHQTIKEALRAAANNRHQQQKKAKLSSSPPSESSPQHQQQQQHPMKPLITPPAHNSFLAPFLLSGKRPHWLPFAPQQLCNYNPVCVPNYNPFLHAYPSIHPRIKNFAPALGKVLGMSNAAGSTSTTSTSSSSTSITPSSLLSLSQQLQNAPPQSPTDSNTSEGGANANSLLMNGAKSADEAATPNPLFTFPFQLNLQQLMESAAMSAQGSSTD